MCFLLLKVSILYFINNKFYICTVLNWICVSVENSSFGLLIRKYYLLWLFTICLLKTNISCLVFRGITNATPYLFDLSKQNLHPWKLFV